MPKYQSDGLTEAQCVLIATALQKELNAVNTADYPPDLEKITSLTELVDLFSDPAGNMIDLEDEADEEDKEDEQPES